MALLNDDEGFINIKKTTSGTVPIKPVEEKKMAQDVTPVPNGGSNGEQQEANKNDKGNIKPKEKKVNQKLIELAKKYPGLYLDNQYKVKLDPCSVPVGYPPKPFDPKKYS